MALSFVGHGCALANTMDLSAVSGSPQIGDLLVVYAEVQSAVSAPSLPSDFTQIGVLGSGSFRARCGYKVLEAGDTTIGTWTGADRVQCNIYNGINPDGPIGTIATSTSLSSGTLRADICLFEDQTGKSWLCCFNGHSSATNVDSRNFAGLTNRSSGHADNGIGAWDSGAGVDNWPSQVTVAANAAANILAFTFEIKALLGEPPAPTPYVWELVDGALPTGLSLDADTGEISGTPSEAGLFEFTIRVSNNYLSTANFECSCYIAPGPFAMEEPLPEATYSMDVGALTGKQEVAWHRMIRVVKRPVVVAAGTLLYVDENNVVQQINKEDALAANAYWESANLNKAGSLEEHTLLRVIVEYEAALETTLVIEASGDGGFTWQAGFDFEGNIYQTKGGLKRRFQGFNVSGTDLRFRVTLPDDGLVYLRSWQAHIIPRQQLESDR